MAIEFGTPFTISDRRRLYTDEERAAFLENLHPAFTTQPVMPLGFSPCG